jgi:hypothetical protein
MYKTIALALALTLTVGCATKPPEPPVQRETINHPALPKPINAYTFKWRVITLEDGVYVGLPYDKSLDFRLMMEDTARYIRDSNAVMCFYRTELEEPQCVKPIRE